MMFSPAIAEIVMSNPIYLVPILLRALAGRLPAGHVSETSLRTSHLETLLPHDAAVGILGADS